MLRLELHPCSFKRTQSMTSNSEQGVVCDVRTMYKLALLLDKYSKETGDLSPNHLSFDKS